MKILCPCRLDEQTIQYSRQDSNLHPLRSRRSIQPIGMLLYFLAAIKKSAPAASSGNASFLLHLIFSKPSSYNFSATTFRCPFSNSSGLMEVSIPKFMIAANLNPSWSLLSLKEFFFVNFQLINHGSVNIYCKIMQIKHRQQKFVFDRLSHIHFCVTLFKVIFYLLITVYYLFKYLQFINFILLLNLLFLLSCKILF